MENEQSSGFFESMKEFLDTIEESGTIEMKVNGIISMFKSTIVYLESSANISSLQSEMLNVLDEASQANSKMLHILHEAQQANLEVFIKVDEKITTLAKNAEDVTSISSKLAEEVGKLAEAAAKIPVINIDNLLKTLNEHAEEINENTASIKAIKDKLIN